MFLRDFEHMKTIGDCLLNNNNKGKIIYSLMTLREERAMTVETKGGGTKKGL